MKTNPIKSRRRRDAKSAQCVSVRQRPAPFQLRRVLVPVDFSACSRRALDYASRLAKELGASLTLLHVVPADYGWLGIGREESRQLDEALQFQSAQRLKVLTQAAIRQQVPADLEVRLGVIRVKGSDRSLSVRETVMPKKGVPSAHLIASATYQPTKSYSFAAHFVEGDPRENAVVQAALDHVLSFDPVNEEVVRWIP